MVATPDQLSLATVDITDTDLYVQRGYPWAEWDLLRREAPVYWYQRPHYEPFWAITKYDDVSFISRHPELFSNAQLLRMLDTDSIKLQQRGRVRGANRYGGSPDDPPDFIFMDPPEHRQHRGLVSRHFTPKMMKLLEDHFEELSEDYVSRFADVLVARLADKGDAGVVDFVHELAAKLPVAAICEMAGIPEQDWDQIFQWTETLGGATDAEYRRPGETREQTIRRNSQEWRAYNEALFARRRSEGLGDDLLSTLLAAEIDGEPLTEREVSSYFRLLLAAGNETTRNSITGGVRALLQHPEQLEWLVSDESMVGSAVEEMLRWTSVVIQFQRTAVEDVELRGTRIRKGESVVIWYPSANRDEEVFPDPYKFDIGREPNDHFAFGGYGEHFCLGANLARWEMRAIFHALRSVLPQMDLVGEAELVAGNLHVGGIKRMLVRARR